MGKVHSEKLLCIDHKPANHLPTICIYFICERALPLLENNQFKHIMQSMGLFVIQVVCINIEPYKKNVMSIWFVEINK